MEHYQPGWTPGAWRLPLHREIERTPGLEPEMAQAIKQLVATDPKQVVGWQRMRHLPAMGITFTLGDICWLSRS